MEVRAVRDKSAGRVEDFPGPVVPKENAAVLEKLEKNGAFATRAGGARKILEVEETREVRAGGARKIREVRAGGARKILGVEEAREENAAVLEKLEKNGAFATLAGEGGVADNSAEVARKVRAGGARETDKTRRKETGVIDKAAGRVEEPGVESPVEAVRDKEPEKLEKNTRN